MKDIKYYLCCFLLLTLTKCVSNLKFYEGPELPKEEIATIDSYYWHIYQIDDKPAGNSQKGYDLLSGFHLIYFEGNTTFVEDYYKKKSTSTKGRGKIGVHMKAGHFYRLSYNQDPDKPNSVITPCIIEYRSSTSNEKLSVIWPEASGYSNSYSESKITTTNQKELAKIAKNDKYTDVREAAVEKLTDQAVLAYVAKNDKDNSVRQTATEKLTDQAALAEIAKNDEDNIVRMTAVVNPNFSNQTLLAEFAKNDKDTTVRAAAVRKITDKVLLADIAKNDIDKYVRSAVVENPNFTDQAVLADIAKNDKESDVRTVAVGKITDQAVLAYVAKNDKSNSVRQTATEKLTNQAALAYVAKNDEDNNIRSTAVVNPNFSNQTLLAELAKNDKESNVRKVAVGKITDQAVLAYVAKNDKSNSVRQTATEKLTNQAALAYVAKNDEDNNIRSTAVVNPNFSNQTLLAELAKNDKESNVRKVAVGKITDQAVLADIAKNDKDSNVRTVAVGKITDKVLLADIAKNYEVRYTRSIEKEMILIPGGTFQMGSNSTQADNNEKPIHTVTISSFYMSKFEVTQGLWKAVMGSHPSLVNIGDTYPVSDVSWNDCQEFIRKLNAKTGKQYRLPTEAEWEYACRAGKTEGHYGTLAVFAWYNGNSGGSPHPVGQKQPNGFGLFDMLGNVYEWCSDWYGGAYTDGSQTNPTGASSGRYRVMRGGSYDSQAKYLREANRELQSPGTSMKAFGFRLASGSAKGG